MKLQIRDKEEGKILITIEDKLCKDGSTNYWLECTNMVHERHNGDLEYIDKTNGKVIMRYWDNIITYLNNDYSIFIDYPED